MYQYTNLDFMTEYQGLIKIYGVPHPNKDVLRPFFSFTEKDLASFSPEDGSTEKTLLHFLP